MVTSNNRIESIQHVLSPSELLCDYPITASSEKLIVDTRKRISDIVHFRNPRFLVVVGPCSVHDPNAALEYAQKLLKLRRDYSEQLEIIMRVYFEKPRSTIGWKGLINDPDLDKSFNVNKGITVARKLLLEINNLGMPAACEFLDIVTGQYYADLVSWGAIGARTSESQVHREMASGLSCPVGFKNSTSGDINIAVDAIITAHSKHIFLSPTENGTTGLFTTTGNEDGHIILRGGIAPNYDMVSVNKTVALLRKRGVNTGVMIDVSHANSKKQYKNQFVVGKDIAAQVMSGNRDIIGCMIESHLVEGRQDLININDLKYGQSITDACISIEQTVPILESLADAIKTSRLLN